VTGTVASTVGDDGNRPAKKFYVKHLGQSTRFLFLLQALPLVAMMIESLGKSRLKPPSEEGGGA